VYRVTGLLIAYPFGWRAMIRTVVIVHPGRLVARNPLKTHEIPWSRITGFRTEDRLIISLERDREIRCWAVQRANISAMLKRHSYVNDVVATLEEIRTARLQ
jgi:hypothetical protein